MAYEPAGLGDKIYPGVTLKDTNVQVQRLVAPLVRFLVRAGDVPMALFLEPLGITSGNDGQHAVGSAHFRNAAADLRPNDQPSAANNPFPLGPGHPGASEYNGGFE